MLSLEHNTHTGEVILVVKTGIAPAWITRYPRAFNLNDPHDWRPRVRLAPHEPALSRKTPTGLLVESRLRAWLLQRFRRKLHDLCFDELCQIAERAQKHPTPKRRVKVEWRK